ncbi:MBL fold metallo-hydrolase [Thermodesulfobacteriota bacterium]
MGQSNHPDMLITILGSGTCVPSLRRSSCAVLIESGRTKILLDSGPGTMRRLLEAGTEIFDISYIFYSHFHPDHTGELVPLLFATKYPDENQRRTPLIIMAGKGFSGFYDGLKSVYGNWIELSPGILDIVELENQTGDTRSFEGFTVESIPVEHRPESLAYRVTGMAGKSVVYSGDTDTCDNIVSIAGGADLLICESALPDDLKVPGHLTPSLAGRIASQANVRKLLLTHFYPECDHVDIEKECRKTYSGPLVLAEDLMRIEIN